MDDGVVEGLKTFNVTLTSDNDVVLVPDVATVVIQELDSEWAWLAYKSSFENWLKVLQM